MHEDVLHFISVQDLWKFKMKINASELEINLGYKTLLGPLRNEEIELAVNEFKACIKQKPATF